MIQYWLCYGKQDKWQAAFGYKKWGVKTLAINGKISSPAHDWERVKYGDILIFLLGNNQLYGYGSVTGKSDTEDESIWPDERLEDKVIYDRRIDIKFTVTVPQGEFAVPIENLEAPFHAGLSELSKEQAQRAIAVMKKEWKIEDDPKESDNLSEDEVRQVNEKLSMESKTKTSSNWISNTLNLILGIIGFVLSVFIELIILFFKGIAFLFTGGQYGQYMWGKSCPKCFIRRIEIDRECCGRCYKKYFG